MDGCQIASSSMIFELKSIWKICFNAHEDEINLFYETLFNLNNTIVYTVNGKPVSSLYLLDISIIQGTELVSGYYIYAAGTLPESRGHGYMRKLILYAENLALERGKNFLALLPANENLYKFYGKLGFEKFFKVRRITLNAEDMEKLSFKRQGCSHDFTIENIYNARKRFFNYSGSAMWKKSHIDYAIKLNKFYGGKTFFSGPDYAICMKYENKIEVLECTLLGSNWSTIIYKILKWHNCDKYIFSLPVYCNFFSQNGEISYGGMIKPLKMNDICYKSYPYLGLTLE